MKKAIIILSSAFFTASAVMAGVLVAEGKPIEYVVAVDHRFPTSQGMDLKKITEGIGELIGDTKHQRRIRISKSELGKLNLPIGVLFEELKVFRNPMPKGFGCAKEPEVPAPTPDPNPGTQVTDWGVLRVRGDIAQKTEDASSVLVCVLDTGIDMSHSDLRYLNGKNFTSAASGDFQDRNGHGTHTAGLVAAVNNKFGVIGASQARIIAGKVLDDGGSGYNSWISEGIYWCADSGAQIISMSLGGPEPSSVILSALTYATARGIDVFAAAGNDSSPDVGYPAGHVMPRLYSVSATDQEDRLAWFSNWGKVDFTCPGVDILSTYIYNDYERLSGTSMATPLCAGIAAIFRARGKDYVAQPMGSPEKFGRGMLIGTDALR